jgi:hypothetical protein
MPDTIVTIKLSVTHTITLLDVLREVRDTNAELGKARAEAGKDGMKAKVEAQRLAVELNDIIERIEN